MKVEITHDSLANTIYKKADDNDRTRLEVTNLINTEYLRYQKNNKLLDADNLNFIRHFTDKIILSKEQQKFIKESEDRVKHQTWGIWGMGILIVACLIYMAGSNYMAWLNTSKAKKALDREHKYILIANDSIQKLLDKEHALKQTVYNKDQLLNRTNSELQDLVMERENLILQLEEKNKELAVAYKKIEGEKEVLSLAKANLTTKLASKVKEQKKANSIVSNQKKSWSLSKKAQLILSQSSNPSNKQMKESFLLSRAAWELYHDNNQAMDILNNLKAKKLQSNTGGFLGRDKPKYTYTHSKIKKIINNLSPQYGKLSPSQISSRLR